LFFFSITFKTTNFPLKSDLRR